jgi:hypothetical protein
MNDHLETQNPHPRIAQLLKQYARELGEITPSADLDARIDALVAVGPRKSTRSDAPLPARRFLQFAAAASFAVLAICAGIFIGMKLEQSRDLTAANAGQAREAGWSSADLTMWPSDSVSFKIPAEYSAQGTLVAVDPSTKNTSTRYWIDVVVSNDGTFRIERIVPADPHQKQGGHDGAAPNIQ